MSATVGAIPPRARRRPVPRFLRHPGLVVGGVLLLLLVLVAIAAPILAPYPPLATDLMNTLAQPSLAHPFGTDQYGRDVLSRLIWGTHVSLEVALAVISLSLSFGTAIGAIAGFVGGWIERGIMALNDILLAFPGFLLALALVAARGSSLQSVIIAIAIAYTPRVATVMRSVVIVIRPRPFIEASHAMGMSATRVLLRHVVPNAMPPVIVVATISAASAILAEAGLSYLGLGIAAPTPTWGNVIADGQGVIASNPWISLSAGLCIAITVIALNLVGDGLRDTLDPQMRRQTGAGLL